MSKAFELVTKEELYSALKKIKDTAYSPIDDDWIWMDDYTPIGTYIDMLISRC